MGSSSMRWFLAPVFTLGLGGVALPGGVRILSPQGNLNFSDIQSAVNAAQDGDVLLVAAGTYGAFAIQDKSVSVMAQPGGRVNLKGTVQIRDLAPHRTVLIDGFTSSFFGGLVGTPALLIENNSGHVRVQTCTFTGSDGYGDFWNGQKFEGGPGGPGAVLNNNLHVAFVHSTIRGGTGWSDTELVASKGGDGGHGLIAQGTALVLYDCSVIGGQGGYVDSNEGGKGGDGARVLDFGVFAAGSRIRGANGGNTTSAGSGFPGSGGNGGDGLRVEAAAQAQLLDNLLTAGAEGSGSAGGAAGQPGSMTTGGGVFHFFDGSARSFALSATVSGDKSTPSLTIQGDPGDEARVFRSNLPGWKSLTPMQPGVFLVRWPALSPVSPSGIVPASGTLTVPFPLAELPASVLAHVNYGQGFVYDPFGDFTLGSPLHFVTINGNAPPDCNGNLLNDYVEMLEGGEDCNGNLVPDSCDVASGTSPDANGNGIPDECEPDTIYVDAAATPGGNGTAGAPFRTIAEGMAVAVAGDSVVVRDGLYVGADNRGLRFKSGQDITVRSENGPSNCIIDCQAQDRAFETINQWPVRARIQGFTIQGGDGGNGGGIDIVGQYSTYMTITDCVIQDCFASNRGGGVSFAGGSRGTLDGCRFLNNATSTASPNSLRDGGGLFFSGSSLILRNCTFEGNQSVEGGGMYLNAGFYGTVITNSVLRENWATERGGGVFLTDSSPNNVPILLNCLVASNDAGIEGGGVCIIGTENPLADPDVARILDSTLVANTAQRGGGIQVKYKQHLDLANSIAWGNVAPIGPQLDLAPYSVPVDLLVDVSYCNVMGGQPGVYVGAGTLNWGPGNIDLDPAFSDSEYHLSELSPCVDSGDNLGVPPDLADLDGDGDSTEPLPIDLDGNPRFAEVPAAPNTGNGAPPLVDLGAYERQP